MFSVAAPYDVSFSMVANLLRRAVSPFNMLDRNVPMYQERVFDLVTNLAIHGELLEEVEAREKAPSDDSPLKHLSPGFYGWLRALTFEALESLVEYQHRLSAQIGLLLKMPNRDDLQSFSFLKTACWNGRVWQAALGSLLIQVTRAGALQINLLSKLQHKVLAGFLEASKRNGWSEQLHSRLVLLSVALMYNVDDTLGTDRESDDDGESIAGSDGSLQPVRYESHLAACSPPVCVLRD